MADEKRHVELWNGQRVEPGQHKDIKLTVSESYVGMNVRIPIHVVRGKDPGPVVFVTAALHGDEINGTGAIRHLIQDPHFKLMRGSVILVPVLNILSFERHSRALPDRRDLNRCFPGSPRGSMASRMARKIFDEIVGRCDYGIDLHTAAMRRTNYPNVRASLDEEQVRKCAEAFGCEIIVNNKGPKGAFRREACKAGCPTIIMEGGEVWKVEPEIVASAIRGVQNVLRSLNMLDGQIESPDYQVIVEKTKWVRAERSGFLQFHVKPGEVVQQDQPLATNANLLGHERAVLYSPFDGVVIGMSTLPAVSPGEPVCHIGKLPEGTSPSKLKQLRKTKGSLEGRLVEQLSSNVMVFDPPDSSPKAAEDS